MGNDEVAQGHVRSASAWMLPLFASMPSTFAAGSDTNLSLYVQLSFLCVAAIADGLRHSHKERRRSRPHRSWGSQDLDRDVVDLTGPSPTGPATDLSIDVDPSGPEPRTA